MAGYLFQDDGVTGGPFSQVTSSPISAALPRLVVLWVFWHVMASSFG